MSTSPTVVGARALARARITEQILEHARGQLREAGPGELSLRAIARDLQMASSAIYRYFPSRDHLLTALLVQTYRELGDLLEQEEGRVRPRTAYGRRFTRLARTLRGWAIQHPHDWALLYGSPVPGYAAPQDTVGPAARVTGCFLRVIVDLQAGTSVTGAPVPARVRAALAGVVAVAGADLDPDLTMRAMAAWSAVMGAVSLELFGHLHNGVLDPDAWFDQLVATLVRDLGLAAG